MWWGRQVRGECSTCCTVLLHTLLLGLSRSCSFVVPRSHSRNVVPEASKLLATPQSCLAAGTQAAVCSLRHFIHWRHPAVVLEEASPWEAPLLYQASGTDWIGVQALF